MKHSSPLLAKLAILLSLLIGTTSAYYAHTTVSTVRSAKASISRLEGEQRQLESSYLAASELLTKEVETPVLDKTVSELLVVVMGQRLPRGVDVTSLLPAKNVTANDAAAFSTMADQVGKTDLKSVRLNMRGTYSSYDELLAYIAKIRELPVAIVYMRVEANSFELALRAYGK